MIDIPPNIPTETVYTKIGDFVVLRNKNDRTSNHMRNGGYERWMHNIFDEYTDRTKIALDIGMSFGFHSMSLCHKFKHVVAIEAQPVIAEIARRTFFLNGVKNIAIWNKFCSDKKEVAKFPKIDYNKTLNSGGVTAAYKDGGGGLTNSGWDGESYIDVESVVLDEALSDIKENIGFIKIDVEGSEYKVLKGAARVLRENRCPLAIEVLDIPAGNQERVDALLVAAGYNTKRRIGKTAWDYLYTTDGAPLGAANKVAKCVSFEYDASMFCPDDPTLTGSMVELYRKYCNEKYDLIQRCKPVERILEIGVRAGYSALAFMQAFPEAQYTGIDARNGTHGGKDGQDEVFAEWAKKLLAPYNITLSQQDTQKTDDLGVGDFDFIHVDGDHTAIGVMHDLDICFQALAKTDTAGLLIDDYTYIEAVKAGVDAWLQANSDKVEHEIIDTARGDVLIRHKRG